MKLYYAKLNQDAHAPTRAYATDAGWDIRSREYASVEPGQAHSFNIGLAVWLDRKGYYLRAAGRSGLASKHGIAVMGGVIDASYRGPISILLVNHGARSWNVEPGMKIAQLIPELIVEVAEAVEAEIETTARGSNGFGSTGA